MPLPHPAHRLDGEDHGGFAPRLAIIILRSGIADTLEIEIDQHAFRLTADAGIIGPEMPVMDLRFRVSLPALRQ